MADPIGITIPISNGGSVTISPNGVAGQLTITVDGTDLGNVPGASYVQATITEADAIYTALQAVIVNIGGP